MTSILGSKFSEQFSRKKKCYNINLDLERQKYAKFSLKIANINGIAILNWNLTTLLKSANKKSNPGWNTNNLRKLQELKCFEYGWKLVQVQCTQRD